MTKHSERLQRFQKSLHSLDCDAFVVDDVTDLYYLTGLKASAGQLFVTPHEAYLLVDNRYIEEAEQLFSGPVVLDDDQKALAPLVTKVSRLGCSDAISYKRFTLLVELLPEGEVVPQADPLLLQRMIKEPEEILLLAQAAELGSRGYDFVCSLLKEGVTERELASQLEVFWLQQGGQRLAFDPIVAFEPNSSKPHYRPQHVSLKRHQSVLLDIGVAVEEYHSDMTRVVFFGKPHQKVMEIYRVVQEAQQAALALCQPGVKIGELDRAARAIIDAAGYEETFKHSLGHGIGLAIHELPRVRGKAPDGEQPLQTGMAITIEPGVYLPGIGGVRLEDTVVITEKGHKNLTQRKHEPMVI